MWVSCSSFIRPLNLLNLTGLGRNYSSDSSIFKSLSSKRCSEALQSNLTAALQMYLDLDQVLEVDYCVLTLLRSLLLMLHLLDEQVKHLRLDELLDKVSSGLGLDGLVEAPLFEHGPLGTTEFHVGRVMAHCFHKEIQEGF